MSNRSFKKMVVRPAAIKAGTDAFASTPLPEAQAAITKGEPMSTSAKDEAQTTASAPNSAAPIAAVQNAYSVSDHIVPSGMPPAASPAALPNPKADIAALDALELHLFAHRYARTGIGCYGMSIDPPAATADRGEAAAILAQEDHELLCAPTTGELLKRLSTHPEMELVDKRHRNQIRVLIRDRSRLVNVPPDEEAAFTRLTTEADDVWRRAKPAGDWASFEPYLDRVVTAIRRLANFKKPGCDPYDVWLDEYEPGHDQAFFDQFFTQIKDVVVPLFADVSAVRDNFRQRPIQGHFDERRQWALASDLIKLEGLTYDSLFLTKTEHPFSSALTTNYGFIAAHVHEDDVMSNVFTMLHEGGHVLYEQGVDPSYNYTSLKGGTSMGMHESQSRFFENYVGRSEAFSRPLLHVLRRHFPGYFNRVTQRQFYLAINIAKAQPIRIEADELTYPLHILVRYEIERELLAGSAQASDVPALWADKYKNYLGISVPNDASGALQDTHWADGMFGYFPTYAFGGAIGAQLRHAMIADGLDWEGLLSEGNLSPIRSWLGKRVWRYGRSKDADEIIRLASGEVFNVRYYTDYLIKKFSAVYGL